MKTMYRVGVVISALIVLSACGSGDISALARANCNRAGFDPHSEKFTDCLLEQQRQAAGSGPSSSQTGQQ